MVPIRDQVRCSNFSPWRSTPPNDGRDTRTLQAYLGHRNIQHTVRYTELAPNRFKTFWTD
jgi:hypothetical protein